MLCSIATEAQVTAPLYNTINKTTVNGVIPQLSIDQLRALSPNITDKSVTYFCTDSGKEGLWKADFSDNSSPDNLGTVLVCQNSIRMKRQYEDYLRPEWFGAKADGIQDDTQSFQNAINCLVQKTGGSIHLSAKKYRIDQTVYITPTSNIPISVVGSTDYVRDSDEGNANNGTTIIRTTSGDIFRCNIDIAGNSVLSTTQQLFGVSFSNLSFVGKNSVVGINCIKCFRTRGTFRNLASNRVDYLILQEDTDASNASNYCDQSILENIKVVQSRKGGIRLAYADASVLSGIYVENPLNTCENGIELFASCGVSIRSILFGFSENHSTIIGSALLRIKNCFSITVEGSHVENSKWDAIFDVFYSNSIRFSSTHVRFVHNEILKSTNSADVEIIGLATWANLNASRNDIKVIGDNTNNNIRISNSSFLSYPSKVSRQISANTAGILNSVAYTENIVNYSRTLTSTNYNVSAYYYNPSISAVSSSSVLAGIRVSPVFSLGSYSPIICSYLAEGSPYIFWGNSGNALEVRGTDASMKMRISSTGNMIVPNIYNINVTGNIDLSSNTLAYKYGGIIRYSILPTGEFLISDEVTNTGEKLQIKGDVKIIGKLKIATGQNASVGNATLGNGVAIITTTASTVNSIVFLQTKNILGTHAAGGYTYDVSTAGTLVITARKADGTIEIGCNSTVSYQIIN